jgi:hypothetical protein
MGCDCFRMGIGGGGEAAPRYRRRTTQRRAAQWLGRLDAITGMWRSKMTKGNWVARLNVRFDQTAD